MSQLGWILVSCNEAPNKEALLELLPLLLMGMMGTTGPRMRSVLDPS